MSLTLLKLLNSTDIAAETIDHKFMVSGQSFLPNGAHFGLIGAASCKKGHIYVPEDWKETIMNAKTKCPKFCVIDVKNSDFLFTGALEEAIINRRKDTEETSFSWMEIRWQRVVRGCPFILQFKETLNEGIPFHKINLEKQARGRKLHILSHVIQDVLYRAIEGSVWPKRIYMHYHLLYIQPIHHAYFENLPVEANTRLQATSTRVEEDDNIVSRMTKTGAEIQRAYAEKNKNDEDYKRHRAAIDKRYREKRKSTETIQERNIRKSKAAIRKQKSQRQIE
ncbi:hypothetical protein ANN_18758 [Periplaneta americana]|uniref:Uncharacterized protein n=1 Tax=Periplaneta americana TaxID=6978 RepID=A0ABQ8SQW9_PERAM|nr:hypothetical protein ANN_18758 [Periplaneta americana]